MASSAQLEWLEHYRIEREPSSPNFRRQFADRWTRGEKIGEGAYGEVYVERHSRTGAERAIKEIRRRKAEQDLMSELVALTRLSRPAYSEFFVQFQGWYDDDTSISLAMEYMKLGDLRKHLREQLFQETEAREIAFQVFSGLRAMHKDGFTHRDLKPENIFVVQAGPAWHIKIGDFGVSKRVHNNNTSLRSQVGTRAYMAPEILDLLPDYSTSYDNKIDIWAAGIILYEIMCGKRPFPSTRLLSQYCTDTLDFPEAALRKNKVSSKGRGLIRLVLDVEPSERPSSEIVLSSPWFDYPLNNEVSNTDSPSPDGIPAPLHKVVSAPSAASTKTPETHSARSFSWAAANSIERPQTQGASDGIDGTASARDTNVHPSASNLPFPTHDARATASVHQSSTGTDAVRTDSIPELGLDTRQSGSASYGSPAASTASKTDLRVSSRESWNKLHQARNITPASGANSFELPSRSRTSDRTYSSYGGDTLAEDGRDGDSVPGPQPSSGGMALNRAYPEVNVPEASERDMDPEGFEYERDDSEASDIDEDDHDQEELSGLIHAASPTSLGSAPRREIGEHYNILPRLGESAASQPSPWRQYPFRFPKECPEGFHPTMQRSSTGVCVADAVTAYVVGGGIVGGEIIGDTWKLRLKPDEIVCEPIALQNTLKRFEHGIVFIEDHLVAVGGRNAINTRHPVDSYVHVLDPSYKAWRAHRMKTTTVGGVTEHSMVLIGRRLFLYGGWRSHALFTIVGNTYLNANLHSLDLSNIAHGNVGEWIKVKHSLWGTLVQQGRTTPGFVLGQSMVQYQHDFLMVCEPCDEDCGSPSVWRFDTARSSWQALHKNNDQGIRAITLTAAVVGDNLYVHGGYPSTKLRPTLYSFHIPTKTWRMLPGSPKLRNRHVMIALGSKLVLFGGREKDCKDDFVPGSELSERRECAWILDTEAELDWVTGD